MPSERSRWCCGARRGVPPRVGGLMLLVTLAFALLAAPVAAAGVIQDDAKLFSAAAVTAAATRSQQVQQATSKTIALRTVATIGSKDDAAASAAADKVFQELQLDGVLLYVVKDAGKLVLKVGQDTRQLVSVGEETRIRNAMLARFNAKDFDGGLQVGLDALATDLRAGAAPSTGGQQAAAPVRTTPTTAPARGMGLFPLALLCVVPLVLIGLAIFFVVRSRRGGGAGGFTGTPQGGGPFPQGGPGYGGPGYGPNQGGGGPGFGAGAVVGGLGGLAAGGLIAHELDERNQRDRQGDLGGDYGAGAPYGQGQSAGYGNDAGVVSDSGQDVGDFGGSGDSGGGDVGSFGGDAGGSDFGGGGDPGGSQ